MTHHDLIGKEDLVADGETPLDAVRRLAPRLDGSVLPVQGPPGSGKTYTGAHMILDLLAGGRRVGVTANGHKVISNLLGAICKAADDRFDMYRRGEHEPVGGVADESGPARCEGRATPQGMPVDVRGIQKFFDPSTWYWRVTIHPFTARRVVPDIVAFVNGLLLAFIECKSPTIGDVWKAEAVKQLRRKCSCRRLVYGGRLAWNSAIRIRVPRTER